MTAETLSIPSAESAPTLHQFDPNELAHLATLTALPSEAERLCSLGRLHVQQKNPERAIERFEAALALAPDNPDCLNDRAIAALMLRDYEDAAHWFEKAVQCAPHNPRLHCNLGNAMRDAGRGEDAMPHFARARTESATARSRTRER
ncbi:TPR repeat [Candidatus Paraburkholderia kirkii]|nr:TPR repeat [Candidatus Paraburkholderia kirkii]